VAGMINNLNRTVGWGLFRNEWVHPSANPPEKHSAAVSNKRLNYRISLPLSYKNIKPSE